MTRAISATTRAVRLGRGVGRFGKASTTIRGYPVGGVCYLLTPVRASRTTANRTIGGQGGVTGCGSDEDRWAAAAADETTA